MMRAEVSILRNTIHHPALFHVTPYSLKWGCTIQQINMFYF